MSKVLAIVIVKENEDIAAYRRMMVYRKMCSRGYLIIILNKSPFSHFLALGDIILHAAAMILALININV